MLPMVLAEAEVSSLQLRRDKISCRECDVVTKDRRNNIIFYSERQ
jgi:hypothetical protein